MPLGDFWCPQMFVFSRFVHFLKSVFGRKDFLSSSFHHSRNLIDSFDFLLNLKHPQVFASFADFNYVTLATPFDLLGNFYLFILKCFYLCGRPRS